MNAGFAEPDEELWKRYRENHDQNAFGHLIKRYRESVLAFLIRMTGGEEDAFDLLQESLRRFAQHYDPSRSAAKTFLFCIASNLAKSYYRSSMNKRYEVSFGDLEEAGTQPAAASDYHRDEMRLALFQNALNCLDFKDRQAIELKDIESMTYKTAADIAGCSEKRFEKRLAQARKRLRSVLTENKEYESLLPCD